jgi:hypothetical protein
MFCQGRSHKVSPATTQGTKGDKGMTQGSSILAYLVFGPGRASAEGMERPVSTTIWRGPGARLGAQCKNSEEQDLVELGLN